MVERSDLGRQAGDDVLDKDGHGSPSRKCAERLGTSGMDRDLSTDLSKQEQPHHRIVPAITSAK
jgi:hypothetical protein